MVGTRNVVEGSQQGITTHDVAADRLERPFYLRFHAHKEGYFGGSTGTEATLRNAGESRILQPF
jgi:hypothetical protein